MRKFIIFVILLRLVYAYDILSVQFDRSTLIRSKEEQSSGIIIFIPDTVIYVKMSKPVTQYVKFVPYRVVFCYPEEQKKIVINYSEYQTGLPFFEAFLNIAKVDFGLSDLNFELINHKVKNDTIISTWKNKKNKDVIKVDLYLCNSYIVKAITKDSHDIILKKVTFNKFSNIDNEYFPMHLHSTTYINDKKNTECITFKNLKFIKQVPDSIKLMFDDRHNFQTQVINW